MQDSVGHNKSCGCYGHFKEGFEGIALAATHLSKVPLAFVRRTD